MLLVLPGGSQRPTTAAAFAGRRGAARLVNVSKLRPRQPIVVVVIIIVVVVMVVVMVVMVMIVVVVVVKAVAVLCKAAGGDAAALMRARGGLMTRATATAAAASALLLLLIARAAVFVRTGKMMLSCLGAVGVLQYTLSLYIARTHSLYLCLYPLFFRSLSFIGNYSA